VLCCRLAPGEPSPGAWTLPGGGVDFGEHPDAAVLRELEEETGLTGRVAGLVAVRSRVFQGRLPDGRGRELHAIAIVYQVVVTGGTLRDEPAGSTDRAAWLSRGDLAERPLTGLLRRAAEETFGTAT
jgi:ADP-ribose pyrophosphatase YjhB (NUDIX family)